VTLWLNTSKKIALAHLTIFLFGISMLTNCSTGWSVGGYELSPQDTLTNTVFVEIVDQDSVVHWYHGRVNNHTNWCYMHDEWEDVKVK
jgi:hypothetical protein